MNTRLLQRGRLKCPYLASTRAGAPAPPARASLLRFPVILGTSKIT